MSALNAVGGLPGVPLPAGMERAPGRPDPAAVAQAFEGVFASLLIKQMRQTVDGDSLFPNDTGDVMGGMFDHFLGEHLAKSGSLGIGQMIRTQLERRSTPNAPQ